MQYPPPSHALTIWLADGHVKVAIPPAPGATRGHVISVDADIDGIKLILSVLKNRTVVREAKLGTPGVPTQAMIDALRAKQKDVPVTTVVKVTHKESKDKARLTLEDLGL